MSVSGELSPGRAVRLRTPLNDLGLVALGGTLGTLARYGIGAALRTHEVEGWFPVATFTVNVVGALLLGVVVAVIGRMPGTARFGGARMRDIRLFMGTGILGGFTTYSGLATETGQLLLGDQAGLGLVYAGMTIVTGLAASALGLWLGGRIVPGHAAEPGAESGAESGEGAP